MKAAQFQPGKRFLMRGLPLITTMMLLGCAQSAFGQWESPSPNPNNIYYNSGTVGIGTTNPQTRLQVSRDTLFTDYYGQLMLSPASNEAKRLVFGYDGTNDFGWIQAYQNSVGLKSLSLQPHGGNVGIGTTNPQTRLQISRDTLFTDLFGQLMLSPASSEAKRLVFGYDGTNDFGWIQAYQNSVGLKSLSLQPNGGNVGIGTTSPLQKVEIVGVNGVPAASSTSVDGILRLQPTGTAATFDFGMNSASSAFAWLQSRDKNNFATNYPLALNPNGGNVGVGTASPGSKLEVSGDVRVTHGTGSFFLDTNSRLYSDSSYSILTDIDGNPRFYFARGGGDVGNSYYDLGNNASSTHYFRGALGASNLMVIKNNGKVGIGTTGPNYLLDVQGGQINASGGLCINGSCKASWSEASAWENNSGSLSYGAGYVGIGTTSPGYRLDVNGGATRIANGTGSSYATRNDVLVFNRTDFLSQYTNKITSSNSNVAADTGINFELTDTAGTGFVTAMSLRGSGNVGIGTTSPGDKLTIAGAGGNITIGQTAFGSDDYNAIYLNGLTGPGNYNFVSKNGDQSLYINRPSGKDLYFRENNSIEQLFLKNGGNVGIGTTSPQNKLHVAGSVTIDGNINAKYQDLAEWVPSSEQLAAGTVVVLDSTKSNQVISSSVSYDTRVAGVISEQPGITLGEKSDSKVLVATTGRVKVKVDASKGPIHIGDLLVTSDVLGVAMKSEPVELAGRKMHMPGTLIGKALEPLEKGSGEILVLLSLQ